MLAMAITGLVCGWLPTTTWLQRTTGHVLAVGHSLAAGHAALLLSVSDEPRKCAQT